MKLAINPLRRRLAALCCCLAFPFFLQAQAICDMGFENAGFNGWTGGIGDNTVSSNGPLQNIQNGIFSTVPDDSLGSCTARHTIISTLPDSCIGIPMVPHGSYCARLGNTCANYQGEYLEYTFLVTPGLTNFNAYYAVVLNDGGHSAGEQPYFSIETYDQSNQLVPGGQYYASCTNGPPAGFSICDTAAATYACPWDTLAINLTAYTGQYVRIRCTAAGCIYAGHFAYAYIDFDCDGITGLAENSATAAAVYPNPFDEQFMIRLPAGKTPYRYRVTNLLGQETAPPATAAAGTTLRIDASGWAKGVYLLELDNGDKKAFVKLVRR